MRFACGVARLRPELWRNITWVVRRMSTQPTVNRPHPSSWREQAPCPSQPTAIPRLRSCQVSTKLALLTRELAAGAGMGGTPRERLVEPDNGFGGRAKSSD